MSRERNRKSDSTEILFRQVAYDIDVGVELIMCIHYVATKSVGMQPKLKRAMIRVLQPVAGG